MSAKYYIKRVQKFYDSRSTRVLGALSQHEQVFWAVIHEQDEHKTFCYVTDFYKSAKVCLLDLKARPCEVPINQHGIKYLNGVFVFRYGWYEVL